MKKLNYILTFIIFTSLLACEPPVTFDEPQPSNTNSLSSFPRRFQGQFQSTTDNSLLKITDKMISRIYDLDIIEHINQLDSNYRLVADTLINTMTKEKTIIKRKGDSIVQHIHYIDTLFLISESNILKKFKGYCFLNFRYNKSNWQVIKLGLNKSKLSIGHILTKEDIDKLKQISESTLDSLSYQFKPTKRQFKKFVKMDGFSNTETFLKVK